MILSLLCTVLVTGSSPASAEQPTNGLPTLAWLGVSPYETDGVDPDGGQPATGVAPTGFVFKIRYTDPGGGAPRATRLKFHRLVCRTGGGAEWGFWKAFPLTLESGDIATGAVYASAPLQLPAEILRYRFYFHAADGAVVGGGPEVPTFGPQIIDRPRLCWTGKPGYAADGVSPDTGPLGTRFTFKARYMDSTGSAPTKHELVLRRDGVVIAEKPLNTEPGGSLFTGTTFGAWIVLNKPGIYTYRFRLGDETGTALGAPSTWQSGPTVADGGASLALSGVASVPTKAGVQLTFALSEGASVTATVLNAAGRPVRALVADRPLAAGAQALLWDGRADTGLPAPPGLYLVRLTAQTPAGAQAHALATVALR